jgi:hypothetical protein
MPFEFTMDEPSGHLARCEAQVVEEFLEESGPADAFAN